MKKWEMVGRSLAAKNVAFEETFMGTFRNQSHRGILFRLCCRQILSLCAIGIDDGVDIRSLLLT